MNIHHGMRLFTVNVCNSYELHTLFLRKRFLFRKSTGQLRTYYEFTHYCRVGETFTIVVLNKLAFNTTNL